jgi:hypothetical protein
MIGERKNKKIVRKRIKEKIIGKKKRVREMKNEKRKSGGKKE